ncbi:hypothetical protein E2C01_047949 [Portunus trituberculatus]|uniref:Uncharacterized protein n=1 Tax=Portunus trituberculatus TaxID=210409 RepID=A0A5B7G4Z2_PORTR|nr:hypothetical protein [Portunus trituberculatus]
MWSGHELHLSTNDYEAEARLGCSFELLRYTQSLPSASQTLPVPPSVSLVPSSSSSSSSSLVGSKDAPPT